MNQQYELNVWLTIKGPLISSGGGDAARGLDRVFSLNANERPVLRGSHVKGKLKDALRELSDYLSKEHDDLVSLFGKEHKKENPDPRHPKRASIQVSDFTLTEDHDHPKNDRNTRVSIDRRTGTSREQHLQTLEKRFESGCSTTWAGTISFFSPDEQTAQERKKQLETGLKWITALGGAKGTGYGCLEKITTELNVHSSSSSVSFDDTGDSITLCFEFLDDLLIGGIKKPKSNFAESEKTIPGSAIKGSLARFLNLICGVTPSTKAINQSNTAVADKNAFPLLAKHYSRLRFLHAFPMRRGQTARPVILPYSALQAASTASKSAFSDAALLDGPVLDRQNRAPRFLIDWKENDESNKLRESFGWGSPEIINKTRTAIRQQTRVADEEKLYTFQHLTPYQASDHDSPDGEKPRVRWISSLMLPQMEPAEKQSLLQELNKAIGLGWRHIGKRNARFRIVDIEKSTAAPCVASRENTFSKGDLAIILLQTDTLMFDGKALAEKKSKFNLHRVYNDYWKDITNNSFELRSFFARQHMSGGYLAKKLYPIYSDCYYPYVLTEAGSVFVLEILNEVDAENHLSNFAQNGLPLPPQIIALLPEEEDQSEHWKNCPYVPENGYGEIIVNLDWHWDNCLSSPAVGDTS